MEHELPEALDGIDEPVTMEGLEEVLRRASQRRRASLVAGAAALLAVGALGGALARGPAGDRPLGFAGQQGQAAPPSTRIQAMPAPGLDGAKRPPLAPLFRREANGVAIRAYRVKTNSTPSVAAPGCGPPASFIQAELSNGAAAGITGAPEVVGDSLAVLGASGFGGDEGEPATWAIVRTGAGVATIRLKAGAASDEMAPQEGIAVLTVPGSGASAVVEGLGGDGSVVANQPLTMPTYPTAGPTCLPPPCPAGPGGAWASPTIPPLQDPGPGTTVPKAGTTIVMPPIWPGPDQGVVDGPIACGSTGIGPPMPPPVTTIPAGQGPTTTTLAPDQGPTVPPPTTGLAPAAPTPPIAATTATSSPPAS